MKTLKNQFSFPLLAALLIFLSSCDDKIKQEVKYTANVPIYQSMAEVLSKVGFGEERTLENLGKIYSYGDLIYIGEIGAGVHVFDNSNPQSPVKLGFINIPSNKDIAIRGNYLYADCHTDLLVLKMNSATNYELVNRVEGIFDYTIPSYDSRYPLANVDPSIGIVIGYRIEEFTDTRNHMGNLGYTGDESSPFIVRDQSFAQNSTPSFGGVGDMSGRSLSTTGGNEGVGGSYAQFMLVDDYLYVMSSTSEIDFFSLQDPVNPTASGDFSPGWDIETLYRNGDHLFIGGRMGMYIYSIDNPADPEYVSEFNHATACDPVVADDDFAYVTLRTGTECWGELNELNVISLENIQNPQLMEVVQMTGPWGLGLDADRDLLFVCDGDNGLKVFNVENPLDINNAGIQHIQGVASRDVIPLDGRLMMIADDGLYQYDYSSGNAWLNLMSVINIGS